MNNIEKILINENVNNNDKFLIIFDRILRNIITKNYKITEPHDVERFYNKIYKILEGLNVKEKIQYLLDFYNRDDKQSIEEFIQNKNGPQREFREGNTVLVDGQRKKVKQIRKNTIIFENDQTVSFNKIRERKIKLNLNKQKIQNNLKIFFNGETL